MKKYVTQFITNLSLTILAEIILILALFKDCDLKMLLLLIFGLYALFKFTNVIVYRKNFDFESLFVAIFSLIAFITTFIIDLKTNNLILLLLIWMGLNALVKLKKVDYYHDRKNKMWLLKLFMLFIYVTSGLCTGLTLFNETTQLVFIGFFLLISGILDTTEVIANIILGDKNAGNK